MSQTVESIVGSRRITNKAGAADFFDVELTTINRWIRKGAPVLKQGSRGLSWELDLNAMAQWHYGSSETGSGENPDEYSPQDRKAWYESETKKRELQVKDRDLIPAGELEPAILTAFSLVSQNLQSIGDTLERRHGIAPEIAEIVDNIVLGYLDDTADKLAAFGPVEAGGDEE